MEEGWKDYDTEDPQDPLNELWKAYRESLPDPEPSAEFMPRLWRRIEMSRSVWWHLRRLAPRFVSVAAALCLLMGALLLLPHQTNSAIASSSYVDVLAQDQSADTPEYAQAVFVENDRNLR